MSRGVCLVCDSCLAPSDSFLKTAVPEIRKLLRAEGWRVGKDQDICPKCVANRKSWSCGYCGAPGHFSSTCPSADQGQQAEQSPK